ncbi:arylsulfatase [Verrucomicrobiales bacterium BCK34]|nr:arylsulfatase [Verrucomicrobiales bacterium BCK34]
MPKSILLLTLLSLLTPGFVVAEPKPNVIYILADDLGYGDLSCYGQDKFETPNIDRLATEGLKFTAHYSGNTVCSPSRAVLMTGQHSGHSYIRGNLKGEIGAPLPTEMTVLPEVFKAAGYRTGGFGKWGLGVTTEEGRANPLTHGFDEFCGWKSQTIAHTYYPSTYVDNGEEIALESGTYLHDIIMDRALGFIEENGKSGTPFFCYIPTAVPHAAMHAPEALHEKWRKKFPQFDNKIGKYGAGAEPCPDVVNPIAGFAAMMENLDNQIGTILDRLESLGISDNTIVMFTSDNGPHKEGGHDPRFWNSSGNLRGHKRDMHEGGIRTPMLVRWPAVVAKNKTTDHLSAFWDVLPTMCEILDQPVPDQNDGISFLPTLKGNEDQPRHDYLYWEFCKGTNQEIYSQAVRMGQWKAYLQKKQKMEIYDLENDPYEENNLASQRPELVSKMEEIIKEAHTPLSSQD